MFWFLHYAVKVLIGLALIGMGALLYANRDWFSPAEAWVETLRRAEPDTLAIQGEVTGRVIRVPTGDSVVIRDADGARLSFLVAGIEAPPPSRIPRSEKARAFAESRDALRDLVLSNEVRVAYTFFVPEGGGLGAVYRGPTNVAVPLAEAGVVRVKDATLKGLPLTDQVALLAAEKGAREAARGIWANTVTNAVTAEGSPGTR